MRIPIVNEQDEVIGYKNIKDKTREDIVRISNLWLMDPEGNILLAQRSFNKDHDSGLWGTAVSGRVEEGETYESNIIKETIEEIGLKDLKPVYDRKLRLSNNIGNRFSQWFTCVVDHNYPFVKQDEEVENIKWFSQDELKKALEETPEIFTPSTEGNLEYFTKKLNATQN